MMKRRFSSLSGRFTEHPAAVGETYARHFATAMGFSWAMLRASFCCGVHAILPFLCERSASSAVTELHDRMVANRRRIDAARDPKGETG